MSESEKKTDSGKEIEPVVEAEAGETEPQQEVIDASPEDALEKALQQVASYKDQALRAIAETENVKRRTVREVEHAHKYALERFAGYLLPVIDSLEKTVESVRQQGSEVNPAAIAEGAQLSLKLFGDALEKAGIEEIDPLGEPFNPELHQAMSMVEAPDAEPGSVIQVLQKGYLLNGRLVRAAMVIVAKAPQS